MSGLDWSKMSDLAPSGVDDAGFLIDRMRAALDEDPIALTLAESPRRSLASAVGLTAAPKVDRGSNPTWHWIRGTDWAAFLDVALRTISKSALSILSHDAQMHLAKVMRNSVFPATARGDYHGWCGTEDAHPEHPWSGFWWDGERNVWSANQSAKAAEGEALCPGHEVKSGTPKLTEHQANERRYGWRDQGHGRPDGS